MSAQRGLPAAVRRLRPPPGAGAKLGVFLRGESLGTLERRGPSRYRFAYSPQAITAHREGGPGLSVSLPVQEAAFPPSQSAPFFEGLLPEGSIRAVIAEKLRLSEKDGFGLLEALGADCAGAVVILPPGESPRSRQGESIRPLTEGDVEALIEGLPRDPLGIGSESDGVRLSLGGVQQKLVLTRSAAGQFGQPLGGAPSTCLLKPEHERYEDLAANEAFCMRVAAGAGLDVAKTELLTVGSTPSLYVERFDRVADEEGRTLRLHQEDMCQALGILPDAKYEATGGPSVAQIVSLLRGMGSRRAALDVNAFAKALLTNFLLGNSDAHGKNFALLYEPQGGVRLAPLYDVVSTAVYPGLTPRMAMSIGGDEDPERVDLASWERLAADAGLGGQLTNFVLRWAAQIRGSAEECRRIAAAEGWHRPVIEAIVDVCRERAGRLIDGG